MDRKKEIQTRLKSIEEESKKLEKELEELNKSYDCKFFHALKENNPGMWYRWTCQEDVFFHFTDYIGSYQDLVRPVIRYTFEIDRRISVLNNGEYVKIAVDSKKTQFTFDEDEFVPADIEEIRSLMYDVQNEQLSAAH